MRLAPRSSRHPSWRLAGAGHIRRLAEPCSRQKDVPEEISVRAREGFCGPPEGPQLEILKRSLTRPLLGRKSPGHALNHKNKRKAFELPLSKAATELLASIPHVDGKAGLIFSHDGQRPIGGFSKFKRRFDKEMLTQLRQQDSNAKLRPWVVHDLRRTARTLMSRAGVQPRHAEMALGHAVPGVEGVYDRHRYLDEKCEAFEALAAQIGRILRPQSNVVTLHRTRAPTPERGEVDYEIS